MSSKSAKSAINDPEQIAPLDVAEIAETAAETQQPKAQSVVYPASHFPRMKRFRQYHPAFIKALLPERVVAGKAVGYTMEEAEKIIRAYFKTDKKGGKT